MNEHFCPKPGAQLELWLHRGCVCVYGEWRGLLKKDVPKYQSCVICRLMNGFCLANYHVLSLQAKKPASCIEVSPGSLGLK